ncbi:MAG: 4-hydroxythreonine-4-phosphate dehydrogenase PdxA [Acidiferrobacterales bacterium]
MKRETPIIALTPGEPAGIGPDLAIRLARHQQTTEPLFRLVLIADPELLHQRASALGINMDLPIWSSNTDSSVSVLPVKTTTTVTPGVLNANNSPYVIDTLKQAVDGCQNGSFDALVTGPVHKGIINAAGIPFTGHTEFLAEQCGVDNVVMMLVTETANASLRVGRSRRPASRDTNASLRVALVTTHLPLAEVSAAITQNKLEQSIRILNAELSGRFGIEKPRILVCGLNPHAGESGYLGREEIDILIPVIERLKDQGLNVSGPAPADTVFTPPMLRQADAVLAMYHDQGLPVLKHAGFGQAVNVTLGLPIIRTSVDHGTALERAATGDIDNGSLDAAIHLACELATK